MRKLIIAATGLGILALGYLGFNTLSASKKEPEIKEQSSVKTAFITKVKNESIPVRINTSGSILAKDRMVIFAEVSGIFMPSSKPYKAGTRYRKGEALIKVNNEEFNASVKSQRSAFKNSIIGILADIQFDYSESIETWKNYLNSIDVDKNLPSLPKSKSDKEEQFISGKNINTSYYNIKNLETRLKKHTIYSPFSGVLVQADITPGTLINQGQKLGEFIKPNTFELELNVNSSLKSFLKIGKKVKLNNINHTSTWDGKVVRINPQININSQTIQIFVEVYAEELNEGEFLEAEINANEIIDAIEIPRKLLIDNSSIYIVENHQLVSKHIQIAFHNSNSVVITGLENGITILREPIPGAFEGMTVKIKKD